MKDQVSDLARRRTGYRPPPSSELWATLTIDGRIRDIRRMTAPNDPTDLVPAARLHELFAHVQTWLIQIAEARHWSIEILDPASRAVVHYEGGRQVSTAWAGEA